MKAKLLKRLRKEVLKRYKPVRLENGWAIQFSTYSWEDWGTVREKHIHYTYSGSNSREEVVKALFKYEGRWMMERLLKKLKK